jgi:hypothetical protein
MRVLHLRVQLPFSIAKAPNATIQEHLHLVTLPTACSKPGNTMVRMVCLLAVTLSFAAAAEEKYATYRNERLGYSIQYPSLRLRPVKGGRDGEAFAALSGNAGFRVFAAPLAGRSPHQLADDVQRICPGPRPYYRVVRPALVAVSCRTGDHIIYQKSLLRGGLEITVRGEYPTRERAHWDSIMTSIARSMRVVPSN